MNNPESFNQFRIKEGPLASTDELGQNGAFIIGFKDDTALLVTVATRAGWEHVCVSKRRKRMLQKPEDVEPDNGDMATVKDIFFKPEETVVEYFPHRESCLHPAPGTRHLWKHNLRDFPMPEVERKKPKQEGLIMLPGGRMNMPEGN
jgi:hypothetical protein